MKRVLFVDDEVQVLKAIKRIFAESEFEMQFCESAAQALEFMGQQPFDMIITDMRMPVMDGIQLLKEVKRKYPKTIRIILSGYSDEQEIIYTLQSNLAKAYIFKPWDNDKLLNIVTQNLNTDIKPLPDDIILYINNMEQLPTTGARYQNIRHAVEDNKDIAVISGEIEKDQTMTAKILQIVNSAYYGIKTGSVKKALSFIGTNELQNLVLSMEIMDCLLITGKGCKTADKLWNHAYYTNKIQHIIQANFLQKKENHETATAGLLHKIGVVLMIKYYGMEYINLLNAAMESIDANLLELEKDKFGFTHPQISAYLLRWWNAPETIIEAAANYFAPKENMLINKEIVSIIHIAQHYAFQIQNLTGFCTLLPESFSILNLDKSKFDEHFATYLK